jgi:mRNA interferase HigB
MILSKGKECRMHVISRKKLVEFWKEYPDSEEPLAAWFKVAEKATWSKWADVVLAYPKASLYKCCIVFNICGGSYRLVVRRDVQWKTLFAVGVFTHQDYDSDAWKAFCECR